ncbi:MAG: hypothetical protein ACK55I_42335, partial [bacterium]
DGVAGAVVGIPDGYRWGVAKRCQLEPGCRAAIGEQRASGDGAMDDEADRLAVECGLGGVARHARERVANSRPLFRRIAAAGRNLVSGHHCRETHAGIFCHV